MCETLKRKSKEIYWNRIPNYHKTKVCFIYDVIIKLICFYYSQDLNKAHVTTSVYNFMYFTNSILKHLLERTINLFL